MAMGDHGGRYLPVNDCLWKRIPQVRIVERRGGMVPFSIAEQGTISWN
ncbi:hypothetical protein QFZ30_002246 [Arthrobacter pascens]|nr:hypothetical protein [Arthrobacter pascens]